MQNVAREYGSKDSSTVPDLVGPKEGAGVGSQPFNGGKEETAHATDWRRLFAASPDQTMKYFPPQLLDGKIVIPVEVIDEGASQWQNSVVAQFIGIVPNFSLFQRLANVMWGGDGKVIVKPAGANLFIIQFPNSTVRDRVLESGPWHVQNKPLIIRRWEPGLKRLEFNMKKLPLWLHLGNVPLELFTNRGLSYIASTLGNPLYMDRITARQERLSYAKICVEIEASMDIPRTIDIVMGNGSTVSISVEVPWYPHRCSRCCMFGHNDKSCPSKPIETSVEVVTKVWKPKQVDAGNIRLGEPQKQKETAVEATVITEAAEVPVRNSPLPLRSSSTNRFAILDAGMDMALKNDLCCQDNVMESREEVTEPRKVRTASAGVAELMKSLKPKKKGPIDKGKPKQNKTGFSVLGETRVKQHKFQQILKMQFIGWKLFHNYLDAPNGRIWVLWNGGMQVDLVATTDQSITCKVQEDSKEFFFSAIYGCNEGLERRRLWTHLISIQNIVSGKPWILAGDFNVIANLSESYPALQRVNNDMKEFIDTMIKLSLFDHVYAGPILTWSNHQPEGFIARKLDRALVNDIWFTEFASSTVEFLPPEVSDHSPVLIQMQQVRESHPKPFRFFNFWTKHLAFLDIVEQSWNRPMEGGPMYKLHGKLKRLKQELRHFNKTQFGNLVAKVVDKRKELADVQVSLLNLPSNARLIVKERSLIQELSELLAAEESYYRQKSRVDWIREGDQNTKFFQKIAAAGQSRSSIRFLIDANGNKLSSFNQISAEAVGFFQNLIGKKDDGVRGCTQELLAEILQTVLPENVRPEICKYVSPEEIKASMFAINGDKSPGPDGFSAHFFKHAWTIVGNDVVNAISDYFQTSRMLPAFNATSVALVPKCPNPSQIKDYRPISCCTIIYKCITRILANRMKKLLPLLVSPSQSAFVVGRSITDNVLLAQELVRGYNRTSLSPRCCIKIDLQKAFDTLDWGFLLGVLEVMKFPPVFIGWIRGCITTSRFSISINGSLVGFFKGERGVRQGDPLSPYLFVIAMNVLSRMLDFAASYGVFSFHPKCKKLELTHLCFADDLLIFSKGEVESIIGVQNVMQQFYLFSGLKLNNAKCELFSSGISRESLTEIHEMTGFKLGMLPIRYLGVPLVTRRLSERDCMPLVDKITARINHWATKFLSYAGRFQLIQSVIFSIQNYWSRHFLLPKSVLKKITQLCSSFFWKGNSNTAHGARVSWNTICHPKDEGGLGLKDILSWNQACFLQNIWAIITKAGSLWIAWIKAYMLKGRSIWDVSATSSSSWNWKKLLQLRELARRFVELKNGAEVWKFPGCKYSTTAVWKELRQNQNKVPWARFLWGSMAIPNHTFITWMAILNRLPTLDRLAAWGINVGGICCFCKEEMETRDHLFFGCNYARGIWKQILQLCGLNRDVGSWLEELEWAIQRIKGKALISIVLRIAWKAYIYFVWRERNRRLHNGLAEKPEQLLARIKEVVRIKLSGLTNIAADDINRLLFCRWGLVVELIENSV